MAVTSVLTPRSMNGFQYDMIMRRLEAAGAGAPESRLYHVCLGTGDKLRVLEVWESRAACERYLSTLGPIVQQVGVDAPPPQIVQTYHVVEGAPLANDNALIVREISNSFNDRDLYGCVERYAAHAEWTDAPAGTVLRGREAIRKWLEGWIVAFDDVKAENIRIRSQGTFVTAELNARGTHTGTLRTPAGEVPATGRRVDLAICQVFELHEGLVLRGANYYDAATLLSQLGIAVALGRAPEQPPLASNR